MLAFGQGAGLCQRLRTDRLLRGEHSQTRSFQTAFGRQRQIELAGDVVVGLPGIEILRDVQMNIERGNVRSGTATRRKGCRRHRCSNDKEEGGETMKRHEHNPFGNGQRPARNDAG
jgi:hypothetical protein